MLLRASTVVGLKGALHGPAPLGCGDGCTRLVAGPVRKQKWTAIQHRCRQDVRGEYRSAGRAGNRGRERARTRRSSAVPHRPCACHGVRVTSSGCARSGHFGAVWITPCEGSLPRCTVPRRSPSRGDDPPPLVRVVDRHRGHDESSPRGCSTSVPTQELRFPHLWTLLWTASGGAGAATDLEPAVTGSPPRRPAHPDR